MDNEISIEEGNTQLLDPTTGELTHVTELRKTCRNRKTFWKVYLSDFLAALGIFDSRQLDVFIYILEHTDSSTNLFIGTYREVACEISCSTNTVSKIMRKLQDQGFLKKIRNGIYAINPNLMMKGNENKRQMLITWQLDQVEKQNKMAMTSRERPAIPESPEMDAAPVFLNNQDGLPEGEDR